jgi:hypothetical protein
MAIKIQGDTVIFDDKVFRPAQLTTVQRDAITSPSAGMFIYNLDESSFEGYDGTAWVPVGTSFPDLTGNGGKYLRVANTELIWDEAVDEYARTLAYLAL